MTHDLDKRPIPDNPRWDRPMHEFLHNVPLDQFVEAVQLQDDDRFRAFHASIIDKRNARLTIVALCRRHRLTLTDLQEMWRAHQVARGVMGMSTYLPKVMENVAKDADSFQDICPTCQGKGKLSRKSRVACPRCNGHGVIQKPGDIESRRMLLEATGVIGKKSLINLNLQNILSFGPEHGMEKVIDLIREE